MNSLKGLLGSGCLVGSLWVQAVLGGELSSQGVTVNRGSNSPSSIELQIPFDLVDPKTGALSHVMEKSIPTEHLRGRNTWSGILIPHREKKYVWVKEYREVVFDYVNVKLVFENGTELTGPEIEQIEIVLDGSEWNPHAKVQVSGQRDYEITQYHDPKNSIFVHFKPKNRARIWNLHSFFESR